MNDKSFTVYLVDDDAGVLNALSRLLRVKGYNVQAFNSPREFLAKCDATAPACVILDVAMCISMTVLLGFRIWFHR